MPDEIQISELKRNLDDITAQDYGFAFVVKMTYSGKWKIDYKSFEHLPESDSLPITVYLKGIYKILSKKIKSSIDNYFSTFRIL